ncbi:MAG: HPF/RaiA family ribosome-associated protein, partial [Pseudomonadota bacterium]
NTDHNVKVHDSEAVQLRSIVEQVLGRFSEHITRLEIHLSDENAGKGGQDDKRCLLEARMENRKPTAVSDVAGTVIAAVEGAAGKMARMIEREVGRLRDSRREHPVLVPEASDSPIE